MARDKKHTVGGLKRTFAIAGLLLLTTGTSFGQEKTAPVKRNSWVFSVNRQREPQGWLFATIRRDGDHWVLEELSKVAPNDIPRDSDLEPFVVSNDLQRWSNFYQNNIGNCDSFSAQNYSFKSACSSQFTGKNEGMAVVGMLFGGSGKAGQRYNEDLVNAAISTIEPEDAIRKLDAIERGH